MTTTEERREAVESHVYRIDVIYGREVSEMLQNAAAAEKTDA